MADFLPWLVSGLHLAVRARTVGNVAIVISNPIYPPFRAAASSGGREQRLAPMCLDADRWCVDFVGTDPELNGNERLLMLRNPYNPGEVPIAAQSFCSTWPLPMNTICWCASMKFIAIYC